MGIDVTDHDEMVATTTKVMAQLVDTVRDSGRAQRGRRRPAVRRVTPSAPGPSRSGRLPRWRPPNGRRDIGSMAPRPDRRTSAS